MVKVRRARANDVEVLFDIRTNVRQNHLSREQLAMRGITKDVVADALEGSVCGWLAEIEDIPAGFAMVDYQDGSVFALFVRPEFEGRGVGQRLLRVAEDALFQLHERIWLETDGSETVRANGFYKANGWVSFGVKDKSDVRYEKSRTPTKA